MENKDITQETNEMRKIFSNLSPDVMAVIDAGLTQAEKEGRNFLEIVPEDSQLTGAIRRAIFTDGVTEAKKFKKEHALFKNKIAEVEGKKTQLLYLLMYGFLERLENAQLSSRTNLALDTRWFKWLNIFGALVDVMARKLTSMDPQRHSYPENLERVIDTLPAQPDMEDPIPDIAFDIMQKSISLVDRFGVDFLIALRCGLDEVPDLFAWMGLDDSIPAKPRPLASELPVSSSWKSEWNRFSSKEKRFAAWARELGLELGGSETLIELAMMVFDEMHRRVTDEVRPDVTSELAEWFSQTVKRHGRPPTIWELAEQLLQPEEDREVEEVRH